MNISKYFFNKRLQFRPVDPLANGLSDEIALERREPQAIRLEVESEEDLQRFWTEVVADIRGGGAVDFSEE